MSRSQSSTDPSLPRSDTDLDDESPPNPPQRAYDLLDSIEGMKAVCQNCFGRRRQHDAPVGEDRHTYRHGLYGDASDWFCLTCGAGTGDDPVTVSGKIVKPGTVRRQWGDDTALALCGDELSFGRCLSRLADRVEELAEHMEITWDRWTAYEAGFDAKKHPGTTCDDRLCFAAALWAGLNTEDGVDFLFDDIDADTDA